MNQKEPSVSDPATEQRQTDGTRTPSDSSNAPEEREAEDCRILGAVEHPSLPLITPEQLTSYRQLFVAGWAFASTGDNVVIRARIGEEAAQETRPEGFRDDVAQAHPNARHAGRSGFGMLLPLPASAGQFQFTLEASTKNTMTVLAEFVLDLPGEAEPGIGNARDRMNANVTKRRSEKVAKSNRQVARRILFASHNLNLEGAPRSLLEVATRLDQRRFTPHVVAPTDGPLREVWNDYDVQTEIEPFQPLGSTIDDYEAAIRRTAGMRSRYRPELVVANTLDSFWSVEIARELSIPSIWIVRESVDPLPYFFERLHVSIAERAAAAFSYASRVVFVSRATEKMFSGVVEAGRSTVIPNGLDLKLIDAIANRDSPAKTRKRLSLPTGRPIGVCVGTSCQRKGQLVMIRAIALLEDRQPQPYFVFVGVRPGTYLSAMEALIDRLNLANQIRLVPETGNPLPYYQAADLFVCPSFQESLPRVVMEAMAFSLPIVASSIFGIPELTRDQHEAILFPAGDESQLALAITQMLDDPTRAKAMGAAARKRLAEKFTLGQTVNSFQDLFDEVLGDATLGATC